MRRHCLWSFGAGKPDAGEAWADALRAAVALVAALLLRQAQAFRVVMAFGDDEGG